MPLEASDEHSEWYLNPRALSHEEIPCLGANRWRPDISLNGEINSCQTNVYALWFWDYQEHVEYRTIPSLSASLGLHDYGKNFIDVYNSRFDSGTKLL